MIYNTHQNFSSRLTRSEVVIVYYFGDLHQPVKRSHFETDLNAI